MKNQPSLSRFNADSFVSQVKMMDNNTLTENLRKIHNVCRYVIPDSFYIVLLSEWMIGVYKREVKIRKIPVKEY